jgi:hypothetical protein
MSVLLIVLVIIIVAFGFVILDRLNPIRSELKWLKERFISERKKAINLADELEYLAPLYFQPLTYTAQNLRRLRDYIHKEFESTLR